MTGADLIALIKKHPVAFVAGFIAIACVAWGYVHSDAVEDARTEFERKETQARKMADNVRHAAGLEEQTAEIKDAAQQLESRLVRAGQLATNLQFFYRLENETGVKLLDARQVQLPPAKANAPRTLYIGVPFNLSAQGTYPEVLEFVRRIEAGPHFSRFGSVTFTKAAAPTGRVSTTAPSEQLTVTLTVEMLGTP